jgi:hypothetical protein
VPDEEHGAGAVGQSPHDVQQVAGAGGVDVSVVLDLAREGGDDGFGRGAGTRRRRAHDEVDRPAIDVTGDRVARLLTAAVERAIVIVERRVVPVGLGVAEEVQRLHGAVSSSPSGLVR